MKNESVLTKSLRLGLPMRRASESGATLLEYALALGLLIGVGIMIGQSLQTGAQARADSSKRILTHMAPCGGLGGNLSGDECF